MTRIFTYEDVPTSVTLCIENDFSASAEKN
jgi:hypothetical protein